MPNGPMTLAALSMDGSEVGQGPRARKIFVQLRYPDWEEDWTLRMAPAFKREPSYINLSNIDGISIVNLNVDDDDEDNLSIDSARSSMLFSGRLSPRCKFRYPPFFIKLIIFVVEEQHYAGSCAPPHSPRIPPRPTNIPSRPNGSNAPVVPPRPSPEHWPPS